MIKVIGALFLLAALGIALFLIIQLFSMTVPLQEVAETYGSIAAIGFVLLVAGYMMSKG